MCTFLSLKCVQMASLILVSFVITSQTHFVKSLLNVTYVNHLGVYYLHCSYKDNNHFSLVLYFPFFLGIIFSFHSFKHYSTFTWVAEQWRSYSPITSRLNFLGLPQKNSSAFFRAISNTRASPILILSIFNEQSPSVICPKRVVRPWKSLFVWSLSSLLKTVVRRGNNWLPSLQLSRMLTIFFAFLWNWGAGELKEQGMMTQEPTRAWIRSGTDGTRERVWTPLHKAAVVTKTTKSRTTQEKGCYALC